MAVVNTHDAKTHFSKLIERALRGEEIIIARAGKPLVRLTPVEPERKPPFPWGWAKGKAWIADDFNELPEDLLALFEAPLEGYEEAARDSSD